MKTSDQVDWMQCKVILVAALVSLKGSHYSQRVNNL
jgi:hypothetical protein